MQPVLLVAAGLRSAKWPVHQPPDQTPKPWQVAALRALAAKAEAELRALSSYFGEDVDAGRQPQICRTMREFLFMFERACAEIEEAKKKAADAERRKVRSPFLVRGV
jgi:hypothetical protein